MSAAEAGADTFPAMIERFYRQFAQKSLVVEWCGPALEYFAKLAPTLEVAQGIRGYPETHWRNRKRSCLMRRSGRGTDWLRPGSWRARSWSASRRRSNPGETSTAGRSNSFANCFPARTSNMPRCRKCVSSTGESRDAPRRVVTNRMNSKPPSRDSSSR